MVYLNNPQQVKSSFQPVGKLPDSDSADKLCLLRSFYLRLLASCLRHVNQESCEAHVYI